jgi:transcriptional regulator with XRE-family HTH domain
MAIRRGPRSRTDADADHAGARGDVDLTRRFVDEVSWFMSENKVTRADLAQAMGVSPGRVSQILSGDENLTLRTLSSVLAAVGATPELVLHPVEEALG